MIARFEMFIANIVSIYRSVQKLKSDEMASLGLKGAHTMCVYYLGRSDEGLSAGELAVLCDQDKAAISRTISELTEAGLVEKPLEAEVRRYKMPIRLTEKGKESSQYIDAKASEIVEFAGNSLSEEERAIFYEALSQIEQKLKKLSGY